MPYLIQGWQIVVDCLPILGVEQEPAQHLRMVFRNDIPDGEEVAETLGHLLTVHCTYNKPFLEILFAAAKVTLSMYSYVMFSYIITH